MPTRTPLAALLAAALAAALPAGAAEPSAAPGDAKPAAGEVAADLAAFVRCVVITAEGKQLSESGRSYYGGFYTRSLRHALALAPQARVREQVQAAADSHRREFKAMDQDQRKAYINGALVACQDAEKALGDKVEPAPPPPTLAQEAEFPVPETDTIKVLAARGKPDMEDYNKDGRFVYGYQVGNVTQLFLFGPDDKLLRIRRYCDKLKGACPE